MCVSHFEELRKGLFDQLMVSLKPEIRSHHRRHHKCELATLKGYHNWGCVIDYVDEGSPWQALPVKQIAQDLEP